MVPKSQEIYFSEKGNLYQKKFLRDQVANLFNSLINQYLKQSKICYKSLQSNS